MARPLRIEFPGALYHITSRGNEKRAIFLDSRDREAFLELLSVRDFTMKEIGDFLGVHYSSVSRAVKKHESTKKMKNKKTKILHCKIRPRNRYAQMNDGITYKELSILFGKTQDQIDNLDSSEFDEIEKKIRVVRARLEDIINDQSGERFFGPSDDPYIWLYEEELP